MKNVAAAVLASMGIAEFAQAAELPGLSYFNGRYEAIGRLPDDKTAVFSEMVAIASDASRLEFEIPEIGRGWLGANPSMRESSAPLVGKLARYEAACLFQNDLDNYPRLTCVLWLQTAAEGPGYVTFWPRP